MKLFPRDAAVAAAHQFAARGVPLIRILRQCGRKDVVERIRELRPEIREARRRLVQVCEDDRELALAIERPLARQTLEKNASERVDVGARIDRSTLDLLGWDVVDGSDEATLARQTADRRHVARKSEVADVGAFSIRPCRDEDVARLYVPVDKALGMRRVKCGCDLSQESESPLQIKDSIAPKKLPQVDAVDVLHREIEDTTFVPRRKARDDVRMVEARGDLRLAQEPLPEALVPCELRIKDLQRYALRPREILSEVDGAHRSLADQRLNAKTGEDGSSWDRRPHRSSQA